jgi:hypothetical protein
MARSRPDDDDDREDDNHIPPPRRSTPRQSDNSSPALVAVGVIGVFGFLLLLGAAGFVYALLRASRNDQAQAPEPAAVQEPGPGPGATPRVSAPEGSERSSEPAPVPEVALPVTRLPEQPDAPLKPPPVPEPASAPVHAPIPPLPEGFRETTVQGGRISGVMFREFKQGGTLLVGFEIGLTANSDVVSYLRPIYRTPTGEEFGTAYGKSGGEVVTVKAKEGYAVGGIRIQGRMNSVCLTFMRVLKDGLDPSDWVVSDWYGGLSGGKPGQRVGDGSFVVGLFGARYAENSGSAPSSNGPICKIGLVVVPNRSPPAAGNEAALAPLIGPGWEQPLPQGWKKSDALGASDPIFGKRTFNELRTDGSLLIGFEVGVGRGKDFLKDITVVTYARSIWLTPGGEDFGFAYGKRPENVITLKAKQGYAVSGLEAAGGPGLEGLAVHFARRTPKGLSANPKDSYVSEWVGGMRPAGVKSVHATSLGTVPVVGIHGEHLDLREPDGRFDALGAIIQIGIIVPNKGDGWRITPPPLANAPTGKTQPTGLGSFPADGSFEAPAPAGGWLIGVEASVVKWQEFDLIAGARPVFATRDKVTEGPFQGTKTERTFRAIAKPGYAVGALVVRAGARVNGFSVVFMRVKDGKLDPKDSYESAWIGGEDGGNPKTKIGGTGDPVVGFTGCTTETKHLGGIGLLVLPPAGK